MMDPGHPGFVGKKERYDCDQCISWHAKQFQFPDQLEENELARGLYQLLGDQQRIASGMAGAVPIAIDFTAVPIAMDLMRIPYASRRLVFEKLLILDRETKRYQALQRENERRKQEAEAKARQM